MFKKLLSIFIILCSLSTFSSSFSMDKKEGAERKKVWK